MKCRYKILSLIVISAMLGGCSPTVKIEAPDKPITINLNVKIEHEIRIKVDRELDQLISQEKGLF
jgi:hypothetical protein